MTSKEKLRSQIDEKYKWDLTSIYKDKKAFEKDFLKAKEKINEVVKYKDKFLSSAKDLLDFLKYDEKTDRLLSKLYYYAHLNYDSDTTVNESKKMLNEVRDLYSKYDELESFVQPNILKTDYSVFEKFYKEEKELLKYKFLIENIYRYKQHTLDESKEMMLSKFSNLFMNPEDTFSSLTDTDLTFPNIKDENNRKCEFNESNYSVFIKSDDRRVRKDAFEILFNRYSDFKNTIASTLSGNVEKNIVLSKIRNYDSCIKSSLYGDNIDLSVYNNLIDTVNKNMNVIYKYYDLRKKVLNLDELHLYDTYTDLIKNKSRNYTFCEAKDLVIKSLSVLGTDYIKNINRAFDERWIDVYHNKGKRSGAYSSGFYDTNPFLLLNYEGKLNDVSTLAHELGHSMHTYYSCLNNPYIYSNYSIFVAEVASTVNELLLSKYLISVSKDKEEKLSIINHLLDLFKSTIYRQTMFAEFEKDIYEKRENNVILTSEFLSDTYYKLVKKYFGNNVIVDDLIRYEWERIPHFYYNFYVYKYATSLSISCYIVNNILNNKEGALDNYLKFLTLGSSMYPKDELKISGIDISDSKYIQSAIDEFNSLIDEFDNLYNS